MTIYAPPIHRECHACGSYFEQYIMQSGNTFGARFWTDGKRDAPMMREPDLLVKCGRCGALLWVDEQKQVEQSDLENQISGGARLHVKEELESVSALMTTLSTPQVGRLPGQEKHLEEQQRLERFQELYARHQALFERYTTMIAPISWGLGALAVNDFLRILETQVPDYSKERYIRLRLWWIGNDSRRDAREPAPMSSWEKDNLRALMSLLDEADDDDRIMMAEAFRELGEFSAARAQLMEPFGDKLAQALTIIGELNEKRITSVQEMRFS